jgi:hypothetical protein
LIEGGIAMLTLEDCIALSGLSEAEIDAIAEHEHVPEMVAAEMASYLVRAPDGMPVVRRVLLDDLVAAQAAGDVARAARLKAALRSFLAHHRGCRCASEDEVARLLRAARR